MDSPVAWTTSTSYSLQDDEVKVAGEGGDTQIADGYEGTIASAYDDNSTLALQRSIRVVVPVFFGLISLLGLVGNVMVIAVVASNRQMRNTTNMLIINLAVADLLFILICVPFTAVAYAIPVWPFGSTWCKVSLLGYSWRVSGVSVDAGLTH